MDVGYGKDTARRTQISGPSPSCVAGIGAGNAVWRPATAPLSPPPGSGRGTPSQAVAAALRMGVAFDRAMLARGRPRNRYADRTEARLWYLRAFAMGAPHAPNRLAHLAREGTR